MGRRRSCRISTSRKWMHAWVCQRAGLPCSTAHRRALSVCRNCRLSRSHAHTSIEFARTSVKIPLCPDCAALCLADAEGLLGHSSFQQVCGYPSMLTRLFCGPMLHLAQRLSAFHRCVRLSAQTAPFSPNVCPIDPDCGSLSISLWTSCVLSASNPRHHPIFAGSRRCRRTWVLGTTSTTRRAAS